MNTEEENSSEEVAFVEEGHEVVWKEEEITHDEFYEVWWCETHDKIYYGGCKK